MKQVVTFKRTEIKKIELEVLEEHSGLALATWANGQSGISSPGLGVVLSHEVSLWMPTAGAKAGTVPSKASSKARSRRG